MEVAAGNANVLAAVTLVVVVVVVIVLVVEFKNKPTTTIANTINEDLKNSIKFKLIKI